MNHNQSNLNDMTFVEIWDPKRQLTLQISTDRLEALYWACRMAMECEDTPPDVYVVLAEAVQRAEYKM